MKAITNRLRRLQISMRQEARIGGVRLPIDREIMSERIIKNLAKGTYESDEIKRVAALVRPGDTVLELGAGLGFVSTYLRRSTAAGQIVSIEANPYLIPYIRKVHLLNEAQDIVVLNGVVGTASQAASVPFYCREDFWMSSLDPDDGSYTHVAETPFLAWGDLLDTYKPTVFTLDIEGGELDIFSTVERMDGIRCIVAEFHPKVYGSRGLTKALASIRELGFTEVPGQSGAVVRAFVKS